MHGAQGRNRTTDTAIFSLCCFVFNSLLDIASLEKTGDLRPNRLLEFSPVCLPGCNRVAKRVLAMNTVLSLTRPPSRSKRTPAKRLKLTEQRIANLAKPHAGVVYIYDTIAPSLAIRVTSAGGRSFVVVKKINGKTQRITLGRFPGLRLDDARQAARTIAGEIAKGDDPVALRRAARSRKTTLADLWPSYLS